MSSWNIRIQYREAKTTPKKKPMKKSLMFTNNYI